MYSRGHDTDNKIIKDPGERTRSSLIWRYAARTMILPVLCFLGILPQSSGKQPAAAMVTLLRSAGLSIQVRHNDTVLQGKQCGIVTSDCLFLARVECLILRHTRAGMGTWWWWWCTAREAGGTRLLPSTNCYRNSDNGDTSTLRWRGGCTVSGCTNMAKSSSYRVMLIKWRDPGQ